MNIETILDQLRREPDVYDDLYGILGCAPTSSREQVIAEYRQRVLHCHPDRNPSNPEAGNNEQQAKPAGMTARRDFEHLTLAYDILCNEEERAKYDRWLGSGIKISFAQWRNLSEQSQSLHWQGHKAAPTLTDRPHGQPPSAGHVDTPSEPQSASDRLLEQFRRYEI